MTRVILDCTTEQAQVLVAALDLYTRMNLGQLEELAELMREGIIPMHTSADKDRTLVSHDVRDQAEEHLMQIKDLLGFARNGSFGIGHPHMHLGGKRAYEVGKVLQKALAIHREPNPTFKGVHYDGLTVRYTQDPEPTAAVTTFAAPQPEGPASGGF